MHIPIQVLRRWFTVARQDRQKYIFGRNHNIGIGEDLVWQVTMTDAEGALGNAIAAVYGPNVTFAMCWFHALACLKKRVQGKPYAHDVIEYVQAMHFTQTQDEFKSRLQDFYSFLTVSDDFEGEAGQADAQNLWLYFLEQ